MADVAEARARPDDCSMPFHMASRHVSVSFCACTGGLPTKYMRLVSPWKPSLMTVTSMLTMSPALRRLSFGNAVADHVVHRGADGLGEPAIVDVGRDRLLDVDDVVVAEAVQLLGGHPGHDVRLDHVQHLGGQAAGDAHFLLLFGGFDGDVQCVVPKRGSWYKARPFLATKPHAHHYTPGGWVSCKTSRYEQGWPHGMSRRPNPNRRYDHVRRVHATDAGSGCPFRTPDPLLEPEDGPLHLRRT